MPHLFLISWVCYMVVGAVVARLVGLDGPVDLTGKVPSSVPRSSRSYRLACLLVRWIVLSGSASVWPLVLALLAVFAYMCASYDDVVGGGDQFSREDVEGLKVFEPEDEEDLSC